MLAGEPFTDRPQSVSPIIAGFMRGYNDGLDDVRRQSLKPYAAACIGTRTADRAVENARRRLIAAQAGGPIARLATRFGLREGAMLSESGAEFIGGSVARQVAKEHDDARHARVLRLIDELIALSEPGRSSYPVAQRPEPAPSGGDREPDREPAGVSSS
jgi:hypothetical protein